MKAALISSFFFLVCICMVSAGQHGGLLIHHKSFHHGNYHPEHRYHAHGGDGVSFRYDFRKYSKKGLHNQNNIAQLSHGGIRYPHINVDVPNNHMPFLHDVNLPQHGIRHQPIEVNIPQHDIRHQPNEVNVPQHNVHSAQDDMGSPYKEIYLRHYPEESHSPTNIVQRYFPENTVNFPKNTVNFRNNMVYFPNNNAYFPNYRRKDMYGYGSYE